MADEDAHIPIDHDGGELAAFVVSDIHVHASVMQTDGENPPSYASTGATPNDAHTDAFSGLAKLVDDDNIQADLLICCGDMTDSARPDALQYAWAHLNDLRDSLGASLVLATPGNHDVDSRGLDDHVHPESELQNMEPGFPFADEAAKAKFWAYGYAIAQSDNARVLLVNSAAHHGYKGEYRHGRIARRTIERIERDLTTSGPRDLNILVMHHHVATDPRLQDDYSAAVDAERLLDSLAVGSRSGPWVVIHGHGHHARVYAAAGSASSPFVFSAGSMARILGGELANSTANQVYRLTFHLDKNDLESVDVPTTFQSWTWAAGAGWHNDPGTGLPARGGFGARVSIHGLARAIAHQVTASGVLKENELNASWPQLRFMMPADLKQLRDVLSADHGFAVSPEDPRLPFTEVSAP